MMNNESGRSMVEMLGVLAIIGVLSVGGIIGYSTAMRKYRVNEIVHAASMAAIMCGTDGTIPTGEAWGTNVASVVCTGTNSATAVVEASGSNAGDLASEARSILAKQAHGTATITGASLEYTLSGV